MTRMNYVLVHYFVILGGDGCHGFITWAPVVNCARSAQLSLKTTLGTLGP